MGDGGSFPSGDGKSLGTAFVIYARRTTLPLFREYGYFEEEFGKGAFQIVSEAHIEKEGKHFDVFRIKLKGGRQLSIHFDVSYFF